MIKWVSSYVLVLSTCWKTESGLNTGRTQHSRFPQIKEELQTSLIKMNFISQKENMQDVRESYDACIYLNLITYNKGLVE